MTSGSEELSSEQAIKVIDSKTKKAMDKDVNLIFICLNTFSPYMHIVLIYKYAVIKLTYIHTLVNKSIHFIFNVYTIKYYYYKLNAYIQALLDAI